MPSRHHGLRPSEAAQAVAAILDNFEDTERVTRLQAELEAVRAELEVSQATVRSLEAKCESLDGKYNDAMKGLDLMVNQRNKHMQRLETLKQEFKEVEAAAARRVE
ncbi:hypothetical protein F0562_027351, partial [Nyssa sinensis]